jgi:hypothetical protein
MRGLTAILVMLISSAAALAHPLKMAYTSVKYNAARQVFEISHRVFQDDFELTLKSNYGYKGGDVFVNQKDAATQKTVNTFFEKNFSITFNTTKPKLKYVKTEQKQQMGIIVWYETEKIDISKLSSVTVYNHIMMESFKEQVNMFHLGLPNDVKHTVKFEVGREREVIRL